MTTQTPDAVREVLPPIAPGHWDTEAGRDMAVQTLTDAHMEHSRKRISDFALANEVFLSPGIANLTDAKERIRWLSASLAVALAALDSRAGDAGEGWKLVPVEPTEDMSDAGSRALGGNATQYRDPNGVWSAMLAAATPAPAVDAVPAGEVEPQLNRHDLYRFMDTLKLSEKREVAKAIRFVPAPLTGETDMQRWSRMLAWAAENGKKTELAIAIRAALSHGEGRK